MKLFFPGVLFLIGFIVLVVRFYRTSKKGYNSTADVLLKGGYLSVLNQRHVVSLIAMGIAIVCAGFINRDWLLLVVPGTKAWLITGVTAAVACFISITSARKLMRNKALPCSNVGSPEMYLFIRALFLIAYELFFRGVLLSYCIAFTTVPIAIVINVLLYAIAHAFSTRQELIGTVPFGILLCLLTLYVGSVWPAVFIHLLLGLPYDVLILMTPKRNTKKFVL